MSDTDFEAYLALLSRFLRLDHGQRDEIRRELRAHIEEAVEAEVAEGGTREQAILHVLDDFGDAAELAARFRSVDRKPRWIMRGTMAAACVGMGLLLVNSFYPHATSPAVADSGTGPAPQTAAAPARPHAPLAVRPQTDPADRVIEEKLAQVLPEVQFRDAPLGAFIEYMQEALAVNVHVHWGDLQQQGIDRDKPVSVMLRNATADRALRLVLDDAGGDAGLGYEVDEGVLIIATRDRLHRRMVTRAYDVRDFLGGDVAAEVPTGGMPGAAGFGAAPGGGRMGPVGGAGGGMPPGYTPYGGVADSEQSLTALITETVEPDSWNQSGGLGKLRVFRNVLVVLQTPDVHRKLERLLNDLREAGAAEPKPAEAATPVLPAPSAGPSAAGSSAPRP
jgi:hypothetical protein